MHYLNEVLLRKARLLIQEFCGLDRAVDTRLDMY